jgi:hypothetical protein
VNPYYAVNAWADQLEDKIAALPGMRWFHFNTTGHAVSWLQHTLFAAAFTLPFALFGHAALGAAVAFAAYVLREIYGGREKLHELGFWPAAFVDRVPARPAYQRGRYTGWLVDGVFDCVGPGLLWWLLR